MANVDFLVIASDNALYAAHLQIPTLAASINILLPVDAGTLLTTGSPITSVKSTTTSGVVQFTGMGVSQTRVITVPDENCTLARTDKAQTFYPGQVFNGVAGGGAVPTTLTNCAAYFVGTSAAAGYVQAVVQNLTATGSSDFVATADTGNDSTGYIDIGINNSTYSSVTWTVNGALDSYVSAVGGGLAVGTDTAGKNVLFYSGGTLLANIRMGITDTYQAIYIGGTAGLEERLSGIIWTKKSNTTLASWTTLTTILGAVSTGVGSLTLPANSLTLGRSIRIKLFGKMQTYSSATQYGFSVLLGAVAVCSSANGTITDGAYNNLGWVLDILLTCVATGNSSTVIGNAMFLFAGQSWTSAFQFGLASSSTAAVNVDTAASNAIDVKFSCNTSNASNNLTCTNAIVEILA
jgi:hypothetical protein